MVEAGYEAAGEEDGDDIGGRGGREEQREKQRERRRERKRFGCDAVMVRFMSRSAVSSVCWTVKETVRLRLNAPNATNASECSC